MGGNIVSSKEICLVYIIFVSISWVLQNKNYKEGKRKRGKKEWIIQVEFKLCTNWKKLKDELIFYII